MIEQLDPSRCISDQDIDADYTGDPAPHEFVVRNPSKNPTRAWHAARKQLRTTLRSERAKALKYWTNDLAPVATSKWMPSAIDAYRWAMALSQDKLSDPCQLDLDNRNVLRLYKVLTEFSALRDGITKLQKPEDIAAAAIKTLDALQGPTLRRKSTPSGIDAHTLAHIKQALATSSADRKPRKLIGGDVQRDPATLAAKRAAVHHQVAVRPGTGLRNHSVPSGHVSTSASKYCAWVA